MVDLCACGSRGAFCASHLSYLGDPPVVEELRFYLCENCVLSHWIAQIAQMAEHWYGSPEEIGSIPGLGA